MTHWIIPPSGMIEPVPAPEFYIDRIGAIELIGSDVRLYLITEQMPLEIAAGAPQCVLALKVRRPLLSLPQGVVQMAQCLCGGHPAIEAEARGPPDGNGRKPHLVRG